MTGSPGIYRAHGQPGSDASRPLRPVRPGFTGHPVTWAQSRGLRRTMPPDAGAHFHTQSMSGKFVSGYHRSTLEGVAWSAIDLETIFRGRNAVGTRLSKVCSPLGNRLGENLLRSGILLGSPFLGREYPRGAYSPVRNKLGECVPSREGAPKVCSPVWTKVGEGILRLEWALRGYSSVGIRLILCCGCFLPLLAFLLEGVARNTNKCY